MLCFACHVSSPTCPLLKFMTTLTLQIMNTIETELLLQTRKAFRSQKDLADKALSQLSDDELFIVPRSSESNSVAIIMQHLAGNMISRWTDFLTTDGEKPDRNRDSEFELHRETAGDLRAYWEKGWGVLFVTLDEITESDLQKTITIRGERHSVVQALLRQVSHYGQHVGQIVYLAKQLKSSDWKTLTIPRGQSKAFEQTAFVYSSVEAFKASLKDDK